MNKPLTLLAIAMLTGFATPAVCATDIVEPPWESPSAVIQRQMAADPAITMVKDSAQHLSFRGGAFAGQPVRSWRFSLPASAQPPQLAIRFAAANTADLRRLLVEKNGLPYEFRGDTRRDALWTAGPSAVFPGLTRHALLTTFTSGREPRAELTFFDAPTPPAATRSELHYTLRRDPHPTPAQLDTYRRITEAMEQAVRFYDHYTAGIVKTDTVFLDPTEATAEGNVNGNIQFGPGDISLRTALHEMSHTVGIGTTPAYHRLTVNERFIGKHALAQLRAITGDDHAVLHADTWHFWPYGLNNPGEDHSIWDYVYHCQMVSAILEDCRELP